MHKVYVSSSEAHLLCVLLERKMNQATRKARNSAAYLERNPDLKKKNDSALAICDNLLGMFGHISGYETKTATPQQEQQHEHPRKT